MLKFTKMHSLGNDFIIINDLDYVLTAHFDLTPSFIKLLADRHLGIGADQILILEPAQSQEEDFYCRIFNHDGSEVGQCGNGLSCIASLIYQQQLTTKPSFVIATCTRKITAIVADGGQIVLDMGLPNFMPSAVPFFTADGLARCQEVSYELSTEYGELVIGVVSMGNPHVVIKVDDVEQVDVERIGAAIAKHIKIFPRGTNVNFMQILERGDGIKLRTYERGVGETLSCGSGACAAVAVGRLWRLIGERVIVYLQHGNLMVKWRDLNSPLLLAGSAVVVFNGEWLCDFLSK